MRDEAKQAQRAPRHETIRRTDTDLRASIDSRVAKPRFIGLFSKKTRANIETRDSAVVASLKSRSFSIFGEPLSTRRALPKSLVTCALRAV